MGPHPRGAYSLHNWLGGACLQHGTSPLMWAAVSDDIDVAKTLINHKARINARNKVSDGSVYMVWLPGEFAMSIV